ncbi:Aspartyl/Asparaginyl beta-hydroxylase [compost metagenome]|jgi:hypothetical protein
MNHFHFLAHGVDVNPLVMAIQRRPELWKEDTYLRDYPQGPFGQIESIMLRFPVKSVKETQAEAEEFIRTHDPHENIDYPPYKLLHEARPLVMNLMTRVQGERLGRVMINKIAPGGRIFRHADTPEHCEYYTRFHVVLQGLPGALLHCGDFDNEKVETINMNTGDVFWFNNALEHEVINNSKDDRISMVVDIRTSR